MAPATSSSILPRLDRRSGPARAAAARRLRRLRRELAESRAQLEALTGRRAQELRLAARVQRSQQPVPLRHPALDVACEFMPVREIGGDYLDVVPLRCGRVALALGDVMGKGIPAALLAANLKAAVRAQLQEADPRPAQVVARVNRLFWEVSPPGLFASLFFAVLEPSSGTLDYVNAGHDHPLLLSGGGAAALGTGGMVLGLGPDALYEPGQTRLDQGDVLVAFSDGIVERSNRSGELYGVERLATAARRGRRAEPRAADGVVCDLPYLRARRDRVRQRLMRAPFP